MPRVRVRNPLRLASEHETKIIGGTPYRILSTLPSELLLKLDTRALARLKSAKGDPVTRHYERTLALRQSIKQCISNRS